jgi:hypothetical protein
MEGKDILHLQAKDLGPGPAPAPDSASQTGVIFFVISYNKLQDQLNGPFFAI